MPRWLKWVLAAAALALIGTLGALAVKSLLSEKPVDLEELAAVSYSDATSESFVRWADTQGFDYVAFKRLATAGEDAWAAFGVFEVDGSGHETPLYIGIAHNSDVTNPTGWVIQHQLSGYKDPAPAGNEWQWPKALVFPNNREGWLATNQAIYRTRDGGLTWERIWLCKDPYRDLDGLQVLDGGHLKAQLEGAATIESADGGTTWTNVPSACQ